MNPSPAPMPEPGVGADAPPFAGERRSPVEGRRWPAAPAFIEPLPTGLQTFASVEGMADRVVELLAGRGYELVPGAACFAHTDTFPKVTVFTRAPTRAEQQWIGAAVLLSPGGRFEDISRLDAALEAAQARRAAMAQ